MEAIDRSWKTLLLVSVLIAGAAAAEDGGVRPSGRAGAVSPEQGPLAARLGEFELTSTFFAGPGAAPEVMRLPARRTPAIGGAVVRLDVGPGPGSFLGTGLEGYDDVAGLYWYVWSDTTTGGVAVLRGALRPDGSGTYEGETPTPFGPSPLRVEIRREGSTEIHDYFVPAEGGERQLLELRYEPVTAPGDAG